MRLRAPTFVVIFTLGLLPLSLGSEVQRRLSRKGVLPQCGYVEGVLAMHRVPTIARRPAPGDVLGWQNIRWGMTESQVRSAIGRPLTEVMEKYADGYSPLKAPVRIRSYLLHAFPIFSTHTGRLVRVQIRSEAPENRLWEALYEWAEQRYGMPTERDAATRDTEAYTWRFPTTIIHLLHVNLQVPRIRRVALIYEQASISEMRSDTP